MNKRFAGLALSLGLLLPLATLAAGIFPDVGDNHLFKAEIESMARAGVIKGNPDGKFYPEKSVNRAEFLKLLYVASGRTPKAVTAKCFVDVDTGSWYEAYVCDAAAKENAFVQGYSDGKFRPGSPVNRTEALKMIFMVFGLSTPDISSGDQDLIKFVDLSVSAWYSKYISAAYKVGVLPIAGEGGSRFYPEKELLRGEAAAYIYNAMNAKAEVSTSSSSSSSSVASSVSSSSSSSTPTATLKNVVFPFKDSDKFVNKLPISYIFELKTATVVSTNVEIIGYYPSDVTCRLYLINESGFSDEYYLGVQFDQSCKVNAALKPGKYQLQIQPLKADVVFNVEAKVGVTDENDGFKDAILLQMGMPRTAGLDTNDLFDWYTFTVDKERYATLEVSPSVGINCIIYTPPEVDQYGFKGPECGATYQYAAGTYTVGVGRKDKTEIINKLTYTIMWK